MPPDDPPVGPAGLWNEDAEDPSPPTPPGTGAGDRSRRRRTGLRGSGDLSPATFAKLRKHLDSLDDKEADPGSEDPDSVPAVSTDAGSAGTPADDIWFAPPVVPPPSRGSSRRSGSSSRSSSRSSSGVRPPRPLGTVGNGSGTGGGSGRGGGSSRSRGSSRGRGASRKNLFRRRSRGRRILIWSLLGFFALLIVGGVILADAYYQAYKVYGTLKQVPALVEQARKQLELGQLPQHDELIHASGQVGIAQNQIAHAGFAFNFVKKLPGFGRPIQAISLATDAASREASAAVIVQDLITKILGPDPGGPAPSPAFHDGKIDVDLLSSVTPRLEEVVADLKAADVSVRAIPTVPFVHNLDDLKAQVLGESAKAVALGERALAGFRLLPTFLGADGPKNYYLALQNNDDQRGTGGAVLSYAIVTIDHGQLSIGAAGPIADIDPNKVGFQIPLPKAASWYLDETGVVRRLANGANYSPDFPVAARSWQAMLEKSKLALKVDGVIALDPYAVAAALVGQTGIQVPGATQLITSTNLVRFVMHDQYLIENRHVQSLVPGYLIKGAYEAIASPKHLFGLMHELSGALVAKHLQVWSADAQVQALVTQLGWDGAIRNTAGGDYLNLAYEKRIGNKIDYFADENVSYDVTILGSGAIRSQYTVGLSLDRMPPNQPTDIVGQSLPYGADLAMFNLYVPGSARFGSVSPSGDFPAGVITLPNPGQRNPVDHVNPKGFVQHIEGAFKVFTQTIIASPGHPGSLRFGYTVPGVVKDTPEGKVYSLTVQHQPLVNPQNLRVVVHLPAGAQIVSLGPGWIANAAKGTVIFEAPSGGITKDFTISFVYR